MKKGLILELKSMLSMWRKYGLNSAINALNQDELAESLDNARAQDVAGLKIHLNTNQTVRETFIKAENEEKLKPRSQNLIIKMFKQVDVVRYNRKMVRLSKNSYLRRRK